MASPFRTFRKNQKKWLAVLGVLTMFSFVFLPIFLDRITAIRPKADVPVITTKPYGSLKEVDLHQFMQQRRVLHSFLEQVVQKIREKGGFARDAMQMANEFGAIDEESTVTNWLMVQRAQELGIEVSNKSVSLFLQIVMRGFAYAQPAKDAKDAQPQIRTIQLGNDDLRSILNNLHVSSAQFAEIWRKELMAQMLVRQFMFSLEGMPPGQRWDYFQRFSRRATVEVLPVSVDEFVKEIADPPQETLKAYFEKHKDQTSSPDSPLPGFRQPHRVAVEYLKADQNKYIDRAAVTDKEIAEYYEQFKDIYYREEPAKPAPEKQPGTTAPATKPVEKQEPAKKPEDSKAAKKPEAQKPAPESKPAPQKPAPQKPAADKTPPAKPVDKPAAGSPAKPAPAEKGRSDADSKKSSSTAPRSLYHFAAFQAKDESAAKSSPAVKPTEPATKPAASGAAASDNKPAPAAAKGDSPGAKKVPPAEKPAEKAAGKPAEKAAEKPAQPEAKQPAESKPKESAAPAPTYIPLEKVKERIRDTLSQRQANAKMQKVLADIQATLEDYHQEWRKWKAAEATSTADEKLPPPPRPDFKELAKQHNLVYEEIPPVSAWDIKAYGISSSNVITGGPETGGGVPFITYAFEVITEFRPTMSQDTASNAYLFWKTQEIVEHVPSFDDPGIADQVLNTWKRAEAKPKARAKAKGLAEEARKAQQTLGKLFGTRPGFQVTKTEPFSWLSFGAIPARFAMEQTRMQISDVQGVEQPGDQFMSTVFQLSPGEISVSANQPETVYYVIRAVDFTPSLDQLWNSFREGPDMQSVYRVASREQQETMRAWMNDLKAQVELKWERAPARAGER